MAAVALAVLAGIASGCGGEAADGSTTLSGSRLAIYSSMPLEGPERPAAADVVRGQRMALREHGRKIGRYRVELVQLDAATPEADRWDPQQISDNARTAAKDPDAIAYIGEFHTGSSAISIPRLNEVGVLEVSPMDTATELTSRHPVVPGSPEKFFPKEATNGRTFARLVPSDRWQAIAQLDYMAQEGVRRLVLLTDDEPLAIGYVAAMEARAAERGIAIAGVEDVNPRDPDNHEVAARVIAARADAIFYAGGAYEGVSAIWRRLGALPDGPLLFAPSTLVDRPFIGSIGAAAEKTYVTHPVLALEEYPAAAQRFARRFAEAYGRTPRPEALYGYEAMSAILAAVERAEERSAGRAIARGDVVAAFRETPRRGTVLGSYAFSPMGEISLRRFGAYRVEGGELRYRFALDP